MPVINIIMPCYYPSEIIRPAFEMFSKQTCKNAIEIIMVNDCSPNTNCKYLDIREEFKSTLNIKYVETEYNVGPGEARQLGIQYATCDWIMFHDDDDELKDIYVIEKYLAIIKHNNNLIQIIGQTLQGKDIKPNISGSLFNLNIIKLFNLSFNKNISWYGEDAFFSLVYSYYICKLKHYFPSFQFYICDFIVYNKKNYNNSITNTLSTKIKDEKNLKYLDTVFNFFLNLPEEQFTEIYLKNNFNKYYYELKNISNNTLPVLSILFKKYPILYKQIMEENNV